MILFISNSGECLPIAYRMMAEGADVKVYLHHRRYKNNYNGIVEKVTLKGLKKAVKEAELVIFDITRVNEKTREDLALLKMFGLPKTSATVFGPVADKIKRSTKVIGASTWTEKIEMDRKLGAEIAARIGMKTPETIEFDSLKKGVEFLKTKGKAHLWVFKPENNMDLDMTYVEKFPGELADKMVGEYFNRLKTDKIDYILQKRVKGVEISTEGWFDGSDWIHFNHTIEDKRLMNYNLGPAIGSQGNTVWIKRDMQGLLVEQLKNLTPYLRRAKYIGPIDINSIVSEEDRQPYFLEFSPRFGYDAIYCLLTLVNGKISDFFTKFFDVDFHDGYASSQRITIPPFPYSDTKLLNAMAKDVLIDGHIDDYPLFWMEDVYNDNDGKLRCAGSDGILGVVAAKGNSIGGSIGNMYRAIDNLKIGSYIQYRTDGGKRCGKAIKQLDEWGVSIN